MRATYPDLADRSVVITGGASGIGAALVRGFHSNGARVSFLDINKHEGEALAKELGAGVLFLECDLLDLPALDFALCRARDMMGLTSVLINNAAVDQRHSFGQIKEEDFDWMMNVNLRHVVFASQSVMPQMRSLGGGAIINISSVAWMRGIADLQLYSAAKAAIVGFTNSLARQLGTERIRVNAVAPGSVLTPRQRRLWLRPGEEAELLARQCLPDPVMPDDVAQTVMFLASDAGRMLTKQCISVNAGSL
jgi:NAD(P)-dependent dehydrogenase (short-subunit alcohol dehydrogenase family)